MSVFISYSQKDEAKYNRLRSGLKEKKIESWDTKAMKLAASLRDQLREAINECDTCVYLATCNSVQSQWCLAEIGAFWGAGKKVIVFIDDDDLTEGQIPPQVRVDLWARDVDQVVETIKSSMLPTPSHSPALLFFFSGEEQEKEKIEIIRRAAKQVSADIRELGKLENLDDETIRLWNGLFLGMPYRQEFSQSLINRLVKWVRAGGNLAISCYELGERHHGTNVNQLAYHFGIYFNSDVVVGPSPHLDSRDKDYDVTLLYSPINQQENSPLFQGVSTIAMKNACSLHLEPGAVPLVLAAPNQIRELITGKYTAEYILALGNQKFEPQYEDPKRAVIALVPEGLTGRGRVLAMGTYDFRGDERHNDNDRFLTNLLHWLTN